MSQTRPTGEQLRFVSSKTGDHILDDYLEAAERGGKRLDELLAQVFDDDGEFDASVFEFRVDPTGGDLEFRVGHFVDPDEGWSSTGQTIFNPRGNFAPATTYVRLDAVSHDNEFYICVVPHTSSDDLDPSKWVKVLDENPLHEAVSEAQFYANQAVSAAASLTGAVNIPLQTFTGDGAQTDFALTLEPSSAEALLVTIDNVVQQPTVAYTVAGNTLTFTTPPPNGTVITVRYLGGTLNQMPVQPRIGNFTLTVDDGFTVQNCSANLTAAMPAVDDANNGFFVVFKTNGHQITIDPAGTEQIDGQATKTFGTDFFLWCDGSAWISFEPQGAISSVFGRVGAVTAQNGDYTAAQITNVPAGNLAATTVQAALNELDAEKAPLVHQHAIADITNLQTTLDAKADLVHIHAIADVTGLQSALDAKADDAHSHVIADITGLQTALDGKADDAHSHAIADVTGLQAALDGKSAAGHTHTSANITDFAEAVDDRVATLLEAGSNITLNYDDVTGTLTISATGGSGGSGISDGDKGDIVVSGSGATWTIDANTVSLDKMQQIATDRLLGRDTAGIGNVELIGLDSTLSFDGAGNLRRAAITGDVAIALGSNVSVITNNAVDNQRLADMANNTIKGRNAGTTGDPQDLTATQVTAMLDVFTPALKGLVPASGGGTANFLRADGTWAAPPGGGGGVTDGDKGDITVSASGATWTIDNNVVSLAKMAQIATDRLLGRDTAGTGNVETISLNATLSFTGSGSIQRAALTGDVTAAAGSNATTISNNAVSNAKLADMAANTIKGRLTSIGDPQDLTGTQVTALLDVFTPSLKGLVPASGGGTANFLRADGTWAAPPGGGGGGSGGGLPLQLPIQDGRYYGCPYHLKIADNAFSVNGWNGFIVAVPFIAGQAKTWTEIGVNVTTGSAGICKAHLGIYADSGGVPGALIVDTGELDLSSAQAVVATISEALDANTWYWLAFLGTGSGGHLTGHANPSNEGNGLSNFILGRTGPGENDIGTLVYATQTYGALPDPFPAVEGYDNPAPYIWLRTGV